MGLDILGAGLALLDTVTLDMFDFDNKGGNLPGESLGEDLGFQSKDSEGGSADKGFFGTDTNAGQGSVAIKWTSPNTFWKITPKSMTHYSIVKSTTLRGRGRRRNGNQNNGLNARLARIEGQLNCKR